MNLAVISRYLERSFFYLLQIGLVRRSANLFNKVIKCPLATLKVSRLSLPPPRILFRPTMSEIVPKADHALSRKGRRYLDNLTRTHLATEDAVQSLLNLVDPFPDDNWKNVGMVGTGSAPTLPLRNIAEFTVSAPPGLAAGATWDLHLAVVPVAAPAIAGTGGSFTVSNAGAAVFTPNPFSQETFTWVAYPSGTNVNIQSPAIATTSKGVWTPPSVLSATAYRFTSMGAELQNISTALNKGGAAYAYRQGMQKEEWNRSDGAFAANKMFRCHMVTQDNVQNVSDIVQFPNTWRGSADDGVVIVNTPLSMEETGWCRLGYTLTHWGSVLNFSGQLQGTYTESVGEVAPWNSSGAFMTGLVQGASILVRCSVGIEYMVNKTDATLVALCRDPVPSSPELMEIFNKILAELPAGFNYRDNPLGEWFDKILSMVADFAPRVGGLLSPIVPGAALIGSAIGTGAKAIQGIKHSTQRKMNEQKSQKKNNKPPPGRPSQKQLPAIPHSSSK